MFPRVSTEASGWREALSDPGIVRTILWRLLLVALSATTGIVVAGHTEPVVAVLVVVAVVLVLSLAWLRLTGRAGRTR